MKTLLLNAILAFLSAVLARIIVDLTMPEAGLILFTAVLFAIALIFNLILHYAADYIRHRYGV